MNDEPPIRSRSHPVLKRMRAAAAGREAGVVLLEGQRLVRDAFEAQARIEVLLVEERRELPPEWAAHGALRRVADGLLSGLGGVKTSDGVMALCAAPTIHAADRFRQAPLGLWLCVCGLGDPSNLGAVARSAEAAGVAGLLLGPRGVRPSNPRAMRASMGSLLRLELVELQATAQVEIEGVRHLRATTRAGRDYREVGWQTPLVLWVGDELGGSALEPPRTAEPVSIPMGGRAESLNAATATALLLFEARRQ